ncbi:nucleotide exchange factor GrpE [Actinacidiphila glaucinigra]|uniref:nucleotide exchange factor GrpE n=1 Tax=Actinacidiphila glaucinigra TaxID=235986 RepID=UPI003722EC21
MSIPPPQPPQPPLVPPVPPVAPPGAPPLPQMPPPPAPPVPPAPREETAADPVPQGADEPASDPFAVVADAVDGLREEMAALGDQFRRRLLNDREGRRGLDELRAELDHTRRAAEGRLAQPLLYDLVLLLDRVDRHPGVDGGFADSVGAELLTLLEKYGMTRIPVTAGRFDPALQEAVGTVPAPRPELAGDVAEVVRHGYRMGDRVVRPQQVRVHAPA